MTSPTGFTAPARAVAMLAETRSPAKLAVEFNWGEYVIWHLGPRIQVSLDGRRETVYAEQVYQEGLAFMFGRKGWNSILDERGADLALVRRDFPAYNLLKLKPGWTLVYEDDTCGLFASDASSVGTELKYVTPRGDIPDNGAGLFFP